MAQAQHRQVVPVPLNNLYETILDFNSYPRFASGVKKCEITGQEGDRTIVRMEVEMMKRIEYSIAAKGENSGEKAKISWVLKEGDFFQQNNGLWELTRVDDHSTAVLYSLDLDFSVSVPSFILKSLIKTTLPKAVDEFAAETKRRMK